MREFRLSKYNPESRNEHGEYLVNEWTEYSDVGKLVSVEDYVTTESAYIHSLKSLLKENKIESLQVGELEDLSNQSSITNGQMIDIENIEDIFRSVLRANYWCKLESKEAYVHFGYDYYSYIGVPTASQTVLKEISSNGLYIEYFRSPYR